MTAERESMTLQEMDAPVEKPAGSTVAVERWTGPKRAGRLPARPDRGPAPTERPRPLVPLHRGTRRSMDDRSSTACVGLGTGLFPVCLPLRSRGASL